MSKAAEHKPQIEPPNPTAAALVDIARHQTPSTPMPIDLVQRAFEQGNLDLVERAMQLQECWEKNQARKAFEEAFARAQSRMPVILKSRTVTLGSSKGYRYEDFATIDRAVKPVLEEVGISYRFITETRDDGRMKVTCVLFGHGHREENSLIAAPDTSGAKNAIQAVGSAQTYLQRYTLKAALGLAASDDDYARSVGAPVTNGGDTGELLSPEQIKTIETALTVRNMTTERLLKWLRAAYHNPNATSIINSIGDIPAHLFQTCLDKIKQNGGSQ